MGLRSLVAHNGWYADVVLAQALRRTFEYSLTMTTLRVNALTLEAPNVVGAIANQDNVHWVALKKVDGDIWLLDSRYSPRRLGWDEYLAFITRYPNTFPIERL